MEETGEGLDVVQPGPDDNYANWDPEEEHRVMSALEDHENPEHVCWNGCSSWNDPEHGAPLHTCERGCSGWENPDWPESCGDED